MAPQVEPDAGGFDMREIGGTLWRQKILLITPVLVFVAVAWLSVASKLPTYTATAVLVLDAHKVQFFDTDAPSPRGATDQTVLRSELDAIASRSTADRVAERLRYTMPPPPSIAPDLATWLQPLVAMLTEIGQEAPLLDSLIRRLGIHTSAPMPTYPTAEELRRDLWVTNDGRSLTIEISYRAHDPVTAAFVANAFAADYLDHQVAQRDAALKQAAEWLGGRLDTLRATLEDSELALARYRATKGLRPTDGERPVDLELSVLGEQLRTVQALQIETGARLRILREALRAGSDMADAAGGLASELLVELRRREASLVSDLDELQARVTPNHPEMRPLQRNLASIRRQIDAEAGRIMKGLENEQASLEKREAMLLESLQELRGAQEDGSMAFVRMQQLQREADANRAIYEAFLGRYKEMTEQAKIQQPEGRLITPAEPSGRPDASRMMSALMIGLIGGGCVGAGLAFLREHVQRPIRGPDDAESLTSLPVIGVLPQVRRLPFRRPEDHAVGGNSSGLTEALRAAHLTIIRGNDGTLSGATMRPKVIMVTSAVPREGKSAFCLSLARLLAEDGDKTLLIDADMRASGISRILAGRKHPDLVDVLSGTASFAQALRKDRKSQAHYLGPRSVTKNPQRLLVGPSFRDLVHTCRERYDWVIIDTPPVMAATDAALIAEAADTTLFVVRCNRTNRDLVAAGLRTLAMCKVMVTGIVLNRAAGGLRYRWRVVHYYGRGATLVQLPPAGEALPTLQEGSVVRPGS